MLKNTTLILCLLVTATGFTNSRVEDTPHNLSSSGPGAVKSQTEDQVCVFCHTPHKPGLGPGLWNRRVNQPITTPYQSLTSIAKPDEPTGPSVLCLSCHDGTIALGEMLRPPRGANRGSGNLRSTYLQGRSRFGTNLSNHHPIGIEYNLTLSNKNPQLAHPLTIDLPLPESKMHCTVCHDPHSSVYPPFLNKPSLRGELCTTCHIQTGGNWDWANSAHAVSDAKPRNGNPWNERKPEWAGKTVAENACENCHSTHNATTAAYLIKDTEENTCFRCHNGSVTKLNIMAETQKFYRHPVDRPSAGVHEPGMHEFQRSTPLHAECGDCHNPHATRGDAPMISFNPGNPTDQNHTEAPFANAVIAGVTGVDMSGQPKGEVEYEYEVCFKCHGVSGKSACENRRCSTASSYQMTRQDNVYNLREKVDAGNPSLISYHPIDTNNPTNNAEVPSLRFDTTLNRSSSRIYCGDCHSGEYSPAAGSGGPAGPHGSRHEAILALNYDIGRSGPGAGLLCFKCHDEGNLLSNESFMHREHLLDFGTTCADCHDPHGSAVFPHLINFMTSSTATGKTEIITGVGNYNEPTWIDNGVYRGTCYLNCHGAVHDGVEY